MITKIKKFFQNKINLFKEKVYFGVEILVSKSERGNFSNDVVLNKEEVLEGEVMVVDLQKGRGAKIASRFLLLAFVFFAIFFFTFGFSNIQKAEAANITASASYLYGDGKTVKLAVGTSTPSIHTAIISNSRADFIIDDTYLSSTTPFVFWLSGDSLKRNIFYSGWLGGDFVGYLGYNDAIMVEGEVYVDDFDFIDSSFDDDILYTITATSTVFDGMVMVNQGQKLIASEGHMYVSSGLTTFIGSSFYANGGTVELKSGNIISTQGFVEERAFNNLIISGPVNSSSNSKVSANNLTITSDGSLTARNDLLVINDFDNQGEINASSSIEVGGFLNNKGVFNTDASLTVGNSLKNTGILKIDNDLILSGDFIQNGDFRQASGGVIIENDAVGGLVFRGGLDGSGISDGNASLQTKVLAAKDNYLFIGNYIYNSTACSQTAGSAQGCELQVYDISNPANPVYVAGRDADGSSNGSNAGFISSLVVSENYLYVGKGGGHIGVCGQSPGSALGCELLIFDISNPANPTYIAGRDIDGSSNGRNGFSSIRSLVVKNNYLYVGNSESLGICSQTAGSAQGCELQVYDISNPANPTYIAGRDSDGSADGSSHVTISSLAIKDNYLFVGKQGNDSACSQLIGFAEGCFLQVYDISNPANPVYVAGRDADGLFSGISTRFHNIKSMVVNGNYLYIGKINTGPGSACSEENARDCSLQVYDITDPIDPIYKIGLSVQGLVNDGIGASVEDLVAQDDLLFVVKNGRQTACSQMAGDANGCEIQVYDISNPLKPFYIEGRDRSGSYDGTTNGIVEAVLIAKKHLYALGSGDGGSCIQTEGLAISCEILIYELDFGSGISGNLTDANTLNQLKVSGAAKINDNASITDLNITTNGKLIVPYYLAVAGGFENRGSFDAMRQGTVVLDGEDQTILGTTTFNNLIKNSQSSATTTFEAGSTFTVLGNLEFSGASPEEKQVLQSTIPTEEWFINPEGKVKVKNLEVSDSNNLNSSIIFCYLDCFDGGNNTKWSFDYPPILLLSADDYRFYKGQATTTLDTIFIRLGEEGEIKDGDELRLIIPTLETDFRFNTNVETLILSGSAGEKVSSFVTYEEEGTVLVLTVIDDFVEGDILNINGLEVGSFADISTLTGYLSLFVGENKDEADAVDIKDITITGLLEVHNHSLGQVNNKFSLLDKTDQTLFTFNLDVLEEEVEVEDLVISLSGIHKLSQNNLSNWRLYQDIDGDGVLSAGDVLLDDSGIFTINNQLGAVTFNNNFTVATATDYIVIADISGVGRDSAIVLDLQARGMSVLGKTSNLRPVIHNYISKAQHLRFGGSGAGGSSARVGALPSEGDGIRGGGTEGSGEEIGRGDNGNRLVYSPNFFLPTAVTTPSEWINPENALESDGNFANTAIDGDMQGFSSFGFNIPKDNQIQGIVVQLNAMSNVSFEEENVVEVQLSWDNGGSWTVAKATPRLSDGFSVYEVGGVSDKWGREWVADDFSPENFRLRVVADRAFGSGAIFLDALQVRVFHQPPASGNAGAGGAL